MTPPVRWMAHPDGRHVPYSAAAVHGGVVYACGQVPAAADGSVSAEMADQVSQCLDNLESVLLAAGSGLDHLLQLTTYLADLGEFDAYDAAYVSRLAGCPLPPRTTVQVAAFRGLKRVEITAIAAVPSPPPAVPETGASA